MMTSTRLGGLACLLILSGACGSAGNPPTDSAAPDLPETAVPGTSESEATPMVNDGHSSRNSLDWAGTYSGVTPCADCPRIRTTVSLDADGRFERTLVYLERSAEPHAEKGRFSWNTAGSAVTLQGDGGAQQYKVGENTLIDLDRDGNPITGDLAGHYVLHKHLHDPAIEGRKWMLTELRGNAVDVGSAPRAPFLVLGAEQSVAGGNASCNSFSGAYVIKSGNRIRFDDNFVATMMVCPDMSTEEQFLDVLRNVDNYAVANGVLSLNRARMAPLARFELADEQGRGSEGADK